MANTYKNAFFKLDTTDLTEIYTCPANTTALIKTIQITNEHTTSNVVEVFITDTSATITYQFYYENMATKTTSNGAIGTIVLEAGDVLKIQTATVDVIEGTVSLVEIDF
jgi:hypothetical protein